ncbi:MAG: hypothetical protein M1830_003052 [Pleopsidium flavum]|nr:MAG: hypothetical protein M1830_003052 [Pleopsidium flavum]
MPTDSSLYGTPRPKSSKAAKDISSSTSLAFTSQLSSLITKDNRASAGRSRPSKSKSDIFTAHNKNTKKRAAKDLDDDGPSAAQTQDIGGVDSATLHRSKRKMEEKARLYAAMKRGDYIPPGGDAARDERGLVDFDRKWAEDDAAGRAANYDTSSDSDNAGSDGELVDYEDEFGRQRRGTRVEAAREERRKNAQARAAEEPDRFSARPSQPSNLIYGDTVQTAAFNPDEPIAAQMETLARKRDRSMTPPEEVHYDANGEVRSKGVGFYSFSKDKEGRRKEMEALERERAETERERKERERRKEKRKQEIESRRQKIREKRGQKQADNFLDGLMDEVGDSVGDPPDEGANL